MLNEHTGMTFLMWMHRNNLTILFPFAIRTYTFLTLRLCMCPPTLLTVRHLVLVGFRVIFHLFAHEHSESRLGCISAAHCLSVRPRTYSRVSSAKVRSPASMWFFMSSAKSIYSSGPSIDPCGTPLIMSAQVYPYTRGILYV